MSIAPVTPNQRLHPSGDQVRRQINVSSRRWVNRNVIALRQKTEPRIKPATLVR